MKKPESIETIMDRIDDKYRKENGYYLSISEPQNFAEQVAKEVQSQTVQYVLNMTDPDFWLRPLDDIKKEILKELGHGTDNTTKEHSNS